ncbi:MAG: hypothetical protein ACJ75C_17675, partial [Actinomycetes bacterium]
MRHPAGPAAPGGRPAAAGRGAPGPGRHRRGWRRRAGVTLTDLPTPTFGGGYDGQARPRMGFFTDTSICIGCKACEVACKEWNQLPDDGFVFSAMSYDNTMALGASTW